MGQKTSVSKEIVNESFKRRVIEEYLAGGVTKESLLKKYNIRYRSAIQTWMKQLGYQDPYRHIHIQSASRKGTLELQGDLNTIEQLEIALQEEKDKVLLYQKIIEWAEKEYNLPLLKKEFAK